MIAKVCRPKRKSRAPVVGSTPAYRAPDQNARALNHSVALPEPYAAARAETLMSSSFLIASFVQSLAF